MRRQKMFILWKDDGKKNDPKKEENKYSVYKSFTI